MYNALTSALNVHLENNSDQILSTQSRFPSGFYAPQKLICFAVCAPLDLMISKAPEIYIYIEAAVYMYIDY